MKNEKFIKISKNNQSFSKLKIETCFFKNKFKKQQEQINHNDISNFLKIENNKSKSLNKIRNFNKKIKKSNVILLNPYRKPFFYNINHNMILVPEGLSLNQNKLIDVNMSIPSSNKPKITCKNYLKDICKQCPKICLNNDFLFSTYIISRNQKKVNHLLTNKNPKFSNNLYNTFSNNYNRLQTFSTIPNTLCTTSKEAAKHTEKSSIAVTKANPDRKAVLLNEFKFNNSQSENSVNRWIV